MNPLPHETQISEAGDELRVLSWNTKTGGRDADGRTDRRELATEIAARLRPHLYFRQEITEEGRDGASMFAEAEPLKLVPLCAPPVAESAHQVAVFIDPSMFSVRRHRIHAAGRLVSSLVREGFWSASLGGRRTRPSRGRSSPRLSFSRGSAPTGENAG